MPRTYFMRHSSELDVDRDTIQALWDANRIAIHFPHDDRGEFAHGDSESLSPEDYSGSARSSLVRLHELAEKGGYVFATYRGKPGGKIGHVEAGSEVEHFRGNWGNKNGLYGRTAVLKSLQLSQARNLSAEEGVSLTAVQPRQGTFCRWHKVGARVAALVDGSPEIELSSLTPDLQEVMCMEYMRTGAAGQHGLPMLQSTLMPVGRAMKDVDIRGVTEDGSIVTAQVTYSHLNQSLGKLGKLDAYREKGSETVYFCLCDKPQTRDGHFVFPLEYVFQEFCRQSDNGQKWLRAAMGV